MMVSAASRVVLVMLGVGYLGGFAGTAGAGGQDPPTASRLLADRPSTEADISWPAAMTAVPPPRAFPPAPAPRSVAMPAPASPRAPEAGDYFVQTIRWDPEVVRRPRPAGDAGSAPAATPAGGPSKPLGPDGDPAVKPADFLDDTAAVTPPQDLVGPPFVDTYFDRSDYLFNYWINDSTFFRLEGLARGYYRNDQRIKWSGLEETFGAEGDLRPILWNKQGDWTISAEGEFFLNMPYGSSILGSGYRANFQVDTFELFQLYVQASWGNWRFRIGKTRTPFGNFRAPMYSNSLFDAPFIRTDVIPFTETGMFAHYQPDWLSLDIGLVNGEPNLDTNSSKGFIGRLGIDRPNWTVGISDKYQDGIGSELMKRHNSIEGVDASVRFGRFTVYSEATADQYGFNHNYYKYGGSPLDLGVRSLYGRDTYYPGGLTGWGYYIGTGYRGENLLVDLNYGSYQPQHIGIPYQDAAIVRFVGKVDYALTKHLHVFGVGLVENHRPREGVLNSYNPWAVTTGLQFVF
jgi:hypothetical protein